MHRLLNILLFLLISCTFADEELKELQKGLSKASLSGGQRASLLFQIGARQSELGMGKEAASTFAKVLTDYPSESGVVLATINRIVLAKKVIESGGDFPENLSPPAQEKILDIIIPRIEFVNTPIKEVFERLAQVSKELSPDGNGVELQVIFRSRRLLSSLDMKSILAEEENFFEDEEDRAHFKNTVENPEDLLKRVVDNWYNRMPLEPDPLTHTFENFSLWEVIQSICDWRNLHISVSERRVVILGPGTRGRQPGLDFRIFTVPKSLIGDDSKNSPDLDFQEFFEDRCVSFPRLESGERASISYDRGTNKLISRNTEYNQRAIEQVLGSYQPPALILSTKLLHVRLEQPFTPGTPVKSLRVATEVGQLQLMGEANSQVSGSSFPSNQSSDSTTGMKAELRISETENQRQYKLHLRWESTTPAASQLQTKVPLYPDVPLALPVPGRPNEALIVTCLVVDQSADYDEHCEMELRKQRVSELLKGL